MKKLLVNLKLISPLYILWIITILIVGIYSIHNLPFTPSFPYYSDLSAHYGRAVASFAHFDGIHYLRLIKHGYDDTGSQAFFPVYPFIIRTLTLGVFDPVYVAIIFNALCLLVSLIVTTSYLTKVQAKRFLLLFLTFPASFFLLANYTESFFILLVVLFFLFLQQKKYLLSAIIAGIASGTRLVGVFLSLSLLIELVRNRQIIYRSTFLLLVSVSGLVSYMYFLFVRFGDPLMFVHVQSMFNNGRSSSDIVLLPQVIYRYLKIFLTATPFSLLYLRAVWEFVTFVLSLVALYLYRNKMNLSASIFCLSAFLLPTLSGTFSSMPRYLIVAIPLFIAISKNMTNRIFWPTIILQYGILIITVALFVQGIFIA